MPGEEWYSPAGSREIDATGGGGTRTRDTRLMKPGVAGWPAKPGSPSKSVSAWTHPSDAELRAMLVGTPDGGACRSSSMNLLQLLDAYLAEREASPRYVESLRRTVRKAASYGLISTCQLEPASVNDFLRRLDLSPTTRGNIRRELLTLWRFAFEQAFTEIAPIRVMRIKQTRKPPSAWDYAALSRLLAAAEADERPVSRRCKLPWSLVMRAWIAVGFDTALRFTDILLLHQRGISNGCVSVNAAKTGKVTVRGLSPYSQAAVAELLRHSPDGSVFRWCVTRRRMLLKWKSFLAENKFTGSSRWLRRSAATYVESERPGSASHFLSHSNPALARLHYVDPTMLAVPSGPRPIKPHQLQ